MHPEALILRRCYPVPVTFSDLRAAAYDQWAPFWCGPWSSLRKAGHPHVARVSRWWHDALKQVTSAIDEVYAVVDGREVRVATIDVARNTIDMRPESEVGMALNDLLIRADEQGYWERPHEVRLDLAPRPVSHNEIAKAVLVGQEYAERHGQR